jgi:hypothetical protein
MLLLLVLLAAACRGQSGAAPGAQHLPTPKGGHVTAPLKAAHVVPHVWPLASPSRPHVTGQARGKLPSMHALASQPLSTSARLQDPTG